ncbi:MAG TPA: two-component regulator propeller domain-containing protein [Verrucomicrobiae bacterium]|nr:two-component regulator propeller domain-containing protein [Verrucomicrobiae bacterium]
MGASEAIQYATPGPDYVIEKVTALPQMTFRAIQQTRDGYLWLGTYGGLIRFDGVRSIRFDVANTPALSSDAVYVMYEDRSGDLWIGTDDGGLIRYRAGQFQSFGAEQGFTTKEVHAICEDRDGRLWVGTRRGLFQRREERFAVFETSNLTAQATINGLAAAPDGSLWIGTSPGLFHLRHGITEPVLELTNRRVQSIGMDSHGVLWASIDERSNARIIPQPGKIRVEFYPIRYAWFQVGQSGSFWLAGYGGILSRLNGLTNMEVTARFEQPSLMSLCEDREGNTWVAPESNGMYRLRRKRVRTFSTHDGLPLNSATTILEDRNGGLWLGTFGRGLFVSKNQDALKFTSIPIPEVANITALLEGADGTLSVGSYHAPPHCRAGASFVAYKEGSPGCRAIYEDRAGGVWVCTLGNGLEHHQDGRLTRYTARDGLASDHTQCVGQDQTGDMWVGTLRGLNRISGGKVVRFPGDEALARRTIRTLYVDQRGVVWIGTGGSGLARFSKGRLQTITSLSGLASDGVEQILEDEDGNFWLGTWAGIVRVSRDELEACADGRQSFVRAMTLGSEDGMLTPVCGSGFQPSCMKARSGTLWFCTPRGLAIVDPKSVKPSMQPPPMHIEEVTADDRSLPLGTRPVRIPPGVSRVSFRYTALSFSAPESIRFRYQLEHYDDGWVAAGAAREATYTRLPAGTYQFRVSASNKDGVWNTAGAVIGVVVIPPWWQNWWFRGLALVGLSAMVFGLYELRIHQRKKARTAQELFARRLIESQEQERKRVAAELHDSLGQSLQVIKGRAQLGLNRAAGLPESAKQFEEISQAAGQAIQEVRAISHALRPAELDQLGLAKAIEWMVEQTDTTSSTRFGCEVDGVVRLPPEMEISIYRIAQEGIQNILKHAHATEAILQLQCEGGTLRFSVFDNGRGLAKPMSPDGHGLLGIAERVRLLGGKFVIQSAPGKGTRLTVTIPFLRT